jgi:PilZ domain
MPLSPIDDAFMEKRRHRRQPVRFSGVVHKDGRSVGCVVQDISASGARIVTDSPVELAVEMLLDLSYAGQFGINMVWMAENRAGVTFRQDATIVAERLRAAWGLLI